MVSFSFEAAGDECEPAPDIMDMINGGEHSASTAVIDEPAAVVLDGEPPVFDEIEEKSATDESESSESDEVDAFDAYELEQEIEEAKAAFTNTALMRSRVEEELKGIKDSEKGILKNLKRLLEQQSYMESKGKKNTEPAATAADAETMESIPGTEGQSEPSYSVGEWVDVDDAKDPAWWAISAETIVEKVSGVGKKKKEALLAAFGTLKEMEDLRGEASRQFKHFSELLPDGIGKGLADQIEEAMLQAIC